MITSEKRIYLLDVTKSMIGRGSVNTPNIFEDVKRSLQEAIDEIESLPVEIDVSNLFSNREYKVTVKTEDIYRERLQALQP